MMGEHVISGELIYKFDEVDRSDLQNKCHLDLIFQRNLDGVVVRNVLNPEQVQSLVDGFHSISNDQKVHRKEVSLYPRGFPAYLDNTEGSVEQDLELYFLTSESYAKNFTEKFGFDFHHVLGEALNQTSALLKYGFQEGFGGKGIFTPSQMRCFLSNYPALPVHCGKVFKKMYQDFYTMLSYEVEVANQVSYFIMLQEPEHGGELELYDVPWHQDQQMHPFESIRMQDNSILNVVHDKSVRKMTIKPSPGDMVIFMGANIWHSVQGFTGSLDRITIGGFLGPSKNGNKLVSWS